MGKRLISANASEILGMNAEELKQSIKASEGRVILSENVATRESFIGDITNNDHIVAIAIGGEDNFENIQVTHESCNHEKGCKQLSII